MTIFTKGDLVKIKGERGRRSTGKVYKDYDEDTHKAVTVIVEGQFMDYLPEKLEPLTIKVYTGGERRRSKVAKKANTRRTQII
jgi:hypothetical protein